MSPARIIISFTVGLACAIAVVLVIVAGSFVVAISGGHSVSVPGLVAVEAGKGSELASAQLAGGAVLVWIVGVGIAMTAAIVAVSSLRRRRRA